MRIISVSVVIPCRNELKRILSVLDCLANQNFSEPFEVLIADGCSDDGTWELLQSCEREKKAYPFTLRLLYNSLMCTAEGLNLAVSNAKGKYIIRLDGHSLVAPDYLSRLVTALRMPNVDVVGPPIKYVASKKSLVAEIVAVVLNSRFGNGGTPSRNSLSTLTPVKHAVMSCYRREVWEQIGGYDGKLISNEDFDFDYRANIAGFNIFAAPVSTYYAISPATLAHLVKQRWRYGLAKADVLIKFPRSLHVRQAVPIIVFPATLFLTYIPPLFWFLVTLYIVLCTVSLARSPDVPRMKSYGTWPAILAKGIIAYFIVHFVWSVGVIFRLASKSIKFLQKR